MPATNAANSVRDRSGSGDWFTATLTSPLLWGGLLTAGFYAGLPYIPLEQELAKRYFAGHWIEYVTTTLFFVGMMILAKKGLRLAAESKAIAVDPLARLGPAADGDDAAQALAEVQRELQHVPPRFQGTHLVRRIRDACSYLDGSRGTAGLEEHLKYRAELAVEGLGSSYAMVRTITWAIPILGFLGTVLGITLAIGNLNLDQLANSLNEVTSGLAVAFDTTALSLGLSLVLVFTSFLIERSEQRILGEVEEYGIRRLAPLFPVETAGDVPAPMAAFADAESAAADMLLEMTERLVEKQTRQWEDSLDAARERWGEVLDAHRQSIDAALSEGMARTLSDHAAQLGQARGEMLTAFELASQQLTDGLAATLAAQKSLQADIADRLAASTQQIVQSLTDLRSDEGRRIDGLVQQLDGQVSRWLGELQSGTDANRELAGELRRQAEILLQVAAQEEALSRLQQRLTENLETLQSADQFEETLHSLNAAVHLLTARAKPKAA